MDHIFRCLGTRALASIVVVFIFSVRVSYAQKTGGTSEIVYDAVGSGITAPKPVHVPNAEYTDRARKRKIQGTAVVSMIVTPKGETRDIKVTGSLDKDLDEQVLIAVRTWRFEPATKDGKPVPFRMSAEVSFKLY